MERGERKESNAKGGKKKKWHRETTKGRQKLTARKKQ